MRLPALLLLCLPAVAAAELHDDASALQPMDVFQLEWADNPQLSPDGKRIVYQRNHFDVMKDRRRSHLWLLDLDRDTHRPLTTGSESDGAAVWAPDGNRISWVTRREGSAQIWTRWMDSGQQAQISQVTESPSGLSYSPDGRWIAFNMRVPAENEPLAKLPKKPEGAEWAPSVKLIEDVSYRSDGGGYAEPGYNQIFLLPADGGTPRQISSGDFQHRGAPQWAADSRAIYISANREEDWRYAPLGSEIHRIDIDSGETTAITERNGPAGSLAISPDGQQIAFTGFEDRKLGYHVADLYLLDLDSGDTRVLTSGFDYEVEDPQWDTRGRSLVFGYDREGISRIGRVDADGGSVRELVADYGGTAMGRPYGGGSFSAAAGRIAYTRGTVERPADVAVVDTNGRSRVLTDLNSDALGRKQLGEVEELWLKSSADGLDVQAWIVKPPKFDASRKYPLLLEIHGGPYANYGPRFAPETQLYASAGYVVLYVNPRGSTSYGQAFADEIQHNYPGQDYDDLISAVDATIAKGYIDTDNLFVTGGSGGGVLTAWIVGHTERFRAAVVAKPVINWTSFALTSDGYTYYSGYWFPAPPWEAHEHYWQRSPLAHVGKVSTPTMLITGENDYRTPISETEQYYQALKLRRVDTAMVRIPEASHGINARPSHMLAQVLNTLGWFERYRTKAE